MNTRDVLAFANGVYSAHMNMDMVGNPYAAGSSARFWLRWWKLMRKAMGKETTEAEARKKEG